MVGLPSLRLRGDYLAIVTLGFGEIVRVLLQGTQSQIQPWEAASLGKDAPVWKLPLMLGGRRVSICCRRTRRCTGCGCGWC